MSAPASPYAKRIVRALLTDLSGRQGLGHEWRLVEDKIKAKVETRWCEIVDDELKGTLL